MSSQSRNVSAITKSGKKPNQVVTNLDENSDEDLSKTRTNPHRNRRDISSGETRHLVYSPVKKSQKNHSSAELNCKNESSLPESHFPIVCECNISNSNNIEASSEQSSASPWRRITGNAKSLNGRSVHIEKHPMINSNSLDADAKSLRRGILYDGSLRGKMELQTQSSNFNNNSIEDKDYVAVKISSWGNAKETKLGRKGGKKGKKGKKGKSPASNTATKEADEGEGQATTGEQERKKSGSGKKKSKKSKKKLKPTQKGRFVKHSIVDLGETKSRFELKESIKVIHKEIIRIFDVLDFERAGKIHIGQVRVAVRALGFYPTEKELTEIEDKMVECQMEVEDLMISLQTFIDVMTHVTLTNSYRPASESELLLAFKTLDTNQHGTFSEAELREALMHEGEPLTEAELKWMLDAGLEGDEVLFNYEQYVQLMSRTRALLPY
nr:dynein regulatory complex protein 8 [Biomphalaria glabrata]